ncbi:MAG: LON peptidase substrate-binding domain-containing protein, partial [Terriglobales bacterium]
MPREKQPEFRHLPMMPIRELVIFPHQMTPFVVGRQSSVRALEAALVEEKKIFLATQHDAAMDEPRPGQIYQVGTIANVVQSVRLPDGNVRVLVEGVERGRIVEVDESEGFFRAQLRVPAPRAQVMTPQLEQLMQRVSGLFEQFVKLNQSLNYEAM